MMIGFTNKK